MVPPKCEDSVSFIFISWMMKCNEKVSNKKDQPDFNDLMVSK